METSLLNQGSENHSVLTEKINALKKKKNAIVLGHFYQRPEVQEVSDFIGDSLALAQKAVNTSADIILMAGVHFMAETVKLLNPDKKVLIPCTDAGCSLADSCKATDLKKFIDENPGHTVISYVNTTNEIKALSDIICTSSNAVQIVNSLPTDEKLIFGPDRNLGTFVSKQTGRQMLLWNGACHVHRRFSAARIAELKSKYPTALVLAHPECQADVLDISDFVGSTAAILNYVKNSDCKQFIISTEPGILHQMQKSNPENQFIPAPPDDAQMSCNECEYMKMITLENIYQVLLNEKPEVKVDAKIRDAALRPVQRMLEISSKLGI
ncbi:MAG: quinolinate synthase NadA [Salinivirgaceae bacterium]|nr:quinolinate synthase NadA [Salinivirgaceae bacterium]